MPPPVMRDLVAALSSVLKFAGPADVALSRYFKANKNIGGRDRGWIAEGIYAVLRDKSLLGHLAQGMGGDQTRRLALLALARHAGLESINRVVNDAEREPLERLAAVDAQTLPRAVRLSCPQWLLDALDAQADATTTDALLSGLNAPAPLDLRVNDLKATREEAQAALTAAGIDTTPMPYSPLGLRCAHKLNISLTKAFTDGVIEVQDEGSQLLSLLVAPKRGEMVADFCAGAGGKTLALGGLMRSTGRLYAFDTSLRRLERFKPRLSRSGLSNVSPVAIDSENDQRIKRLAGKMDRVLVDAPCSGLGTLRRNPDLKWRQTEKDVVELAALQARILASAARLVKPGGRLVYATCSILNAENDVVADAFLASHPEFVELNASYLLNTQQVALPGMARLRLAPHTHGTDGFFAVAMQRNT
ncbi:MAG: RsmB/NOP family class I SAM-dependent RNA methyltransferase [Burkholderiaceae bacterium]